MRNIYIVVFSIFALLGFYFGINLTLDKTLISPHVSSEKQSAIPSPSEEVKVGIPKRIVIPAVNIDSMIESVTVDADGNMDIPKEYNNTAWYSPGPKPGETGSAVIDGHVDTPEGKDAVFANIKTLKVGDTIKVVDENNNEHNFIVSNVVDYDLSQMPLGQIFSKEGEAMLNLITCAGVFDKAKKMYSHRTVVYSKLL